MKKINTFIKNLFLTIPLSFLTFTTGFSQTITNSGLIFNPDTLQVTLGDNINFNISANHNAVEVSETTFNNNGSTSNNGFNIPYGGGSWTADSIKTYYYVCQPHASTGMKGVIISMPLPCDPYNLSTQTIIDTSATIKWESLNATNYSIKWRVTGTTGWNPATTEVNILSGVNTDSLIITGLLANTSYDWRIRPYGCSPTTNWFDGPSFTTTSSCNKSLNQYLTGFDPNPVYGPWVWSFDTLSITNTSNCDVRIRPEFDISHDSLTIGVTDFDLKWYNPIIGNWPDIPFYIDANGHAVGYWSTGADTTGAVIAQGATQQVIIKVRFRPSANYGTYTAIWKGQEVDNSGNFIQTLATGDTTSLSMVDCSIYAIDSVNSSQITCFNDNNGTANIVSIENGSGNTLYNWSNGNTTSSISNLAVGNYYCIVTDANWQQCYDSISFTITQPDSLFATENIIDVSCFGDSNGVATLIISGGTTPYTENWSSTTQYNLPAGIYSYSISDSNGCSITDTVNISEPPLLSSTITSTNITNCSSPDGSIDITVTGGFGSYSYNWDNGSISEDLNNLSAGNYLVTISDDNNCSTSNNATIIDYISNITTSLFSNNLLCYNDINGVISSLTSGAAGSVTYSWSDGQTTVNATNLIAGNYTLAVTDSLGCIATDSYLLTQPNPLSSNFTQTNVSCFGGSNGSALVNFSGGVTDYTLFWDTLVYPLTNGLTVFATTNIVPEGVYPYTVIDANGCSHSDSITITQPDSLTLSISTDTICCYNTNTGFANATINGGAVPYTYSWSNGVTTQNLTNVPSGTYTLTVTDANNCTETLSVFIAEYDTLITSYSATDLLCFGDNNGCITTNTTGGSSNYTYSWNTGETTPNICNLSAGTYTCTITDGCGCTTSITVTINEPAELASSYTQTNVSCFGINDGSATINFSGGTFGNAPNDTNYILGWDTLTYILPYPLDYFTTPIGVPAGIYPYTVTDLNGCTIYDTISITQPDSLYTTYGTTNFSGYEISCFGGNDGEIDIQVIGGTAPFENYLNGSPQSTLITSNLSTGIYTDSIVDANGCTAINTIILNEPAALTTSLSSTNISCNGICDGEVYTFTNGGIPPYSYNWGGPTNNLCAGNYNVITSDANGCTQNSDITINEPNPISFSIDSISNISTYGGNDGAIYISASGGFGDLAYYWTNASGFTSISEDIDNLIGGIYSLNITDSNSCALDTFIELTQPSSLVLILDSAIAISCYDYCDAALFISGSGGDSTYTYSWTGPNGFSASTADISNLCHGEYILVLDDSITMLIDTFNVYQPQPLTTTLTTDSILCHNGTTQSEINVWGGTQNFDYLWSNGDTTYITTLSSGNYSVTATDQNGCAITNSISLANPDSIYAQTTTVNVNCNGLNNGEVVINIIGGSTPYSYSDDGGNTYQNSNVFDNLTVGTYTYLITDYNGCLSSAFAEIIQPISITSITESDSVSCYGNCDGAVYAFASGGIAPYSYDWGGNSSNLCSGNYNVIITDANGCIATNTTIIYEPFPLAINIWINGNTIEATSGFDSYQWYYANGTPIAGETSEIYEPLSVGEYYVVVTYGDCEEVSYAINYNISGIENLDFNISIYPNPTMGTLTIEGGSNIQNIIILNTLGNQLLSVENNSNDYIKSEIDLTTFAKGIYFIQVEKNNQIMNYRIVLQ